MEAGYYTRRNQEFEHTRAICYFAVRPYMKYSMPIHEFWELPGDKAYVETEEKRLLEILAESKKLFEQRKKN